MAIIYNELGVQPLGYSGYADEIAFVPNPIIDLKSSIHKINSTKVNIVLRLNITDSIHLLNSDIVLLKAKITTNNAIHRLYSKRDWNAPVNFECGTYLDTPKELRTLDTKKESRVLDTEYQNRYLETPYKC